MSYHESIEKAQDAFDTAAANCVKAMVDAGWPIMEVRGNLESRLDGIIRTNGIRILRNTAQEPSQT